jgi:hypothetical protein
LKKYQRKMRERFYCSVAALLFGLIPFLTMAATPTASPVSSGIEGVILISPSRPGPARIDQPNAAPAPNVTFAVMRDGARITSLTTDSEGRFRVSLPPGHYSILRDDPGAKIGHWRFEADVKPGEVTTVRWTADSGMR